MLYFLRKVGLFLLTLWAALTLNFLIPRIAPGDPAEQIVRQISGNNASVDPAQIHAVRIMLGLNTNQNLIQQYSSYLTATAHLNFGISYTYYPYTVMHMLKQTLPWSLLLVGVSTILGFVIGVVLGAYAAWRRNSRFDSWVSLGSTFIGTLPFFWIALAIVYLLSFTLNWFPSGGGYSGDVTQGLNGPFIRSVASHAVLPALSLLITAPIGWILGMRNTMVLVISDDYTRLARAKGLPEWRIALWYGARNAILPQVTGLALALAGVIGGTVLVEQIFNYPGTGRLLFEALGNRDYPLLQTIFLFSTIAVLIANLIADMIYGVLDPRVRGGGSNG